MTKVEIEQKEAVGKNSKAKRKSDASHTPTFTPLQHSSIGATSDINVHSHPNMTSINGDVQTLPIQGLLLQDAQHRPP